jgi:nucleoside-diphosphate-sugar epimerase
VALDLSPGEQLLELVHVDDVTEAFLQAHRLLRDDPHGAAGRRYSVRSEEPLRLREVVAQLEAVLGIKVPVRWGSRAYRTREVMSPWRGPLLPGWRPSVSLQDGLRRMVASDAPSLAAPLR